MYSSFAIYSYLGEDEQMKEHFSEDLTLLCGDILQSYCDVTWSDRGRFQNHTSIPKSVVCRDFHDSDVDSGRVLFVYTDWLPHFVEKVLPRRTQPFVLVTHNSDHGIEEQHRELLDHPLVLHMYSQNTHISHPKLTALPIGIANAMWPHGNQTNFKEMISSAPPLNEKRHRVYANVNQATNMGHRSMVMNTVKNFPFVDVVQPNKNHREYLKELASYKWVVSPKGNGVDCHRLWECLYAGCIPLVDDTENTRAFRDMGFPILLIKDWNTLSIDALDRETQALDTSRSPKLDASYWRQLFHSH